MSTKESVTIMDLIRACDDAYGEAKERYRVYRQSGYSFDELISDRITIYALMTTKNSIIRVMDEEEQ